MEMLSHQLLFQPLKLPLDINFYLKTEIAQQTLCFLEHIEKHLQLKSVHKLVKNLVARCSKFSLIHMMKIMKLIAILATRNVHQVR